MSADSRLSCRIYEHSHYHRHSHFNQGKGMNADSPLKISAIGKILRHACLFFFKKIFSPPKNLSSRLFRRRTCPIKPLGRPQRYCVKHYSCDVLAQQDEYFNYLARQGGGRHSPALALQKCTPTESTEGSTMKPESTDTAVPDASLIPPGERYLSKPEVAARFGMTARTIEHWMRAWHHSLSLKSAGADVPRCLSNGRTLKRT